MITQELAEIFDKMASAFEFFGNPGDGFKIRAYKNAALALVEVSEPLERLVKEGRVREISGIGQGIAQKIEEYVTTGHVKEFEALQKQIPKEFFKLIEIPSLGPKKVRALYLTLGVETIDQLKKVLEEDKVKALPGFGAKSAQNILEGIGLQQENKGRHLIGEVYLTVTALLKTLRAHPAVDQAEVAGSFRRAEETVGDIDLLVTAKDANTIPEIMRHFVTLPGVVKILGEGATKSSVITKEALQIDLRVVAPELFGSALQYFTGSKRHNVHLRSLAKARGYKLSEYGFFKGEELVASKAEEECYRSIGMQYVPPELRTDTGEIEAAEKGTIPQLIELSDIRGDLHTHSTWTDGNNTIEEMAASAQERGYEYIALTDHSPSLRVANGLTEAQLKEKRREIDELQDRFKVNILFGTEVDILPDGSIDYPDEILRQFDIVVASVHSRFNQDNTARIIAAMENPQVHIIGHPSGRLINQRAPYSINYEKIFKRAIETGTVLEINAQYRRLDLQDIYIRQAKEFGCLFSIDSDAHTTDSLGLMELGIRWARRGWIEKKNVVNTLTLAQLKKTLKH